MPIPVLSVEQMRQWENATWATGRTEIEVIERVGERIAARALRMTRSGDRILILAGKGHNGDDARKAQPHLSNRDVKVLNVTNSQEALIEFHELTNFDPTRDPQCSHCDLQTEHPALIIDGLFGIGLNRPLDDNWQKLIEAINATQVPILSIDVPSGLNAESGRTEGAAIRADLTLTIGAPKRGLFLAEAAPFVGRLDVASDVGLVDCPYRSDLNWVVEDDFRNFPPRRAVASHKGSFGHVAIIAGSLGYHGAAVLAARGAAKAQPGLVTLVTQENVYQAVASQLQAAMVHPWRPGQKLPESTTAILFGPGLAADGLSPVLKNELRSFWNESPLPVIADASALDWLPAGAVPRNPLRVITPHPGEAARLLKTTSRQVQNDRVTALRDLSKHFGNCWVVLKGHQTLVGRESGNILVNSSGNPFLAQGGSGDALAGFIAGHLTQPELQRDPQKTISFAVWNHGATADKLSERKQNWVVEDMIEHLGER